MKENSYDWYRFQQLKTEKHIEETWPEWMKNTSDIATATFPVVNIILDTE